MALEILKDGAFTALIALAMLVPIRSAYWFLAGRRYRQQVDRRVRSLRPLSREAVERLAQDVFPGRRNARWN